MGTNDVVLNVPPLVELLTVIHHKFGVSNMSNTDNQSEIEALQTLLTRGVITQEQFDQLSAGISNSPTEDTPPPPPPTQSKSSAKKKTLAITTLAVVLLAAGVGLIIKQQQDSQRRDKQRAEQEVREKKDAEYRAKREVDQKACSDRLAVINGWSDYLDEVNKNLDASRASSLAQAKKWSLEKGDATGSFRRILKQVDHPTVISSRDSLLRQINLIEDAYTLMGGANTWSEYNSLITSSNLLGNDLNEFKDDLFDSLLGACQGE